LLCGSTWTQTLTAVRKDVACAGVRTAKGDRPQHVHSGQRTRSRHMYDVWHFTYSDSAWGMTCGKFRCGCNTTTDSSREPSRRTPPGALHAPGLSCLGAGPEQQTHQRLQTHQTMTTATTTATTTGATFLQIDRPTTSACGCSPELRGRGGGGRQDSSSSLFSPWLAV
jgi:hypothetical protein